MEEFKPDPYIATVLNCLFWVFYGMPFVHPDSVLVITINGIGLILELTYLSIFFVYATNKGRVCANSINLLSAYSYFLHVTYFLSIYTFIFSFFWVCFQKKVVVWLGIEFVFYAAIILITLLTLHGTKKRSLMVGIICDFFNIMMYASPLTVMVSLLKYFPNKYFPNYIK